MSFYRGTASHPWHDLSPGADAPDVVNAVIEIPRGSKVKYELDKVRAAAAAVAGAAAAAAGALHGAVGWGRMQQPRAEAARGGGARALWRAARPACLLWLHDVV